MAPPPVIYYEEPKQRPLTGPFAGLSVAPAAAHKRGASPGPVAPSAKRPTRSGSGPSARPALTGFFAGVHAHIAEGVADATLEPVPHTICSLRPPLSMHAPLPSPPPPDAPAAEHVAFLDSYAGQLADAATSASYKAAGHAAYASYAKSCSRLGIEPDYSPLSIQRWVVHLVTRDKPLKTVTVTSYVHALGRRCRAEGHRDFRVDNGFRHVTAIIVGAKKSLQRGDGPSKKRPFTTELLEALIGPLWLRRDAFSVRLGLAIVLLALGGMRSVQLCPRPAADPSDLNGLAAALGGIRRSDVRVVRAVDGAVCLLLRKRGGKTMCGRAATEQLIPALDPGSRFCPVTWLHRWYRITGAMLGDTPLLEAGDGTALSYTALLSYIQRTAASIDLPKSLFGTHSGRHFARSILADAPGVPYELMVWYMDWKDNQSSAGGYLTPDPATMARVAAGLRAAFTARIPS